MIELIIMIVIGLMLVRWLRPKPGELSWPTPPIITIHIHGPVLVRFPQGEGEEGLERNSQTGRQILNKQTTRGPR